MNRVFPHVFPVRWRNYANEPVMPEYIDDSNGPDLVGRRIVWRMGQIAWNIVVTGRRESVSEAFQHTQLNAEQQETVRNEIIGLIKRKISDFPTQRTAIRDFSVLLVGGVPHIKARPGDTFPEIPFPEFGEPESEPETGSDGFRYHSGCCSCSTQKLEIDADSIWRNLWHNVEKGFRLGTWQSRTDRGTKTKNPIFAERK